MSARGRAAALETYANNSATLMPQGFSSQERRYLRRSVLWHESSLERVRKCGRITTSATGEVSVRVNSGIAGFAGLCTCGSVWACPVCNAKIMSRRALELGLLLAAAQSQGWWLAFLTFTARHRQGQPLSPLWDALTYAWASCTSQSRSWRQAKAQHGVEGFVRAAEVTYGRNGWHPHLHPLLMGTGKMTEQDVRDLHRWMFDAWQAALVRKGYAAPLLVGQDARLVTGPADVLAEYVSKSMDHGTATGAAEPGGGTARKRSEDGAAAGTADLARALGLELTHSQGKRARQALSTRPTWDLLDDVIAHGDADALDLWHEYEAASYRRRQITYSQGLRKRLGLLMPEISDEEIAAQEVGTSADDLVFITAEGWSEVVRRPILQPLILTAARTEGLAAVRQLLDREGIHYRTPPKGA